MEIELTKPILAILLIFGLVVIGLFLTAAYNWVSDILGVRPIEQNYDYNTQLEFLNWSICARTDAIQMYEQNPDSNHPNVLKLKHDIDLYNRMANELRKTGNTLDNFSASGCKGGN